MMFAFPKQAEVGRSLPKNKIYAHAKASRSLQVRFVAEVDRIVWAYKLAPETLNIPATKSIKEIQVFDIFLKLEELHDDLLRAIDKTIRHPIVYRIQRDGETRSAMTTKQASAADNSKWVIGDYFSPGWQAADQPVQDLPVSLNLSGLYEQLLRAHLPLPPKEGERLEDQIARIALLRQRERQSSQLEKQLQKSTQFNRKVELNQQLRRVKAEIKTLST